MSLSEEKHWKYYLTNPVIFENPIFDMATLEQFFELFKELTEDVLFKIYPEELIKALKLTGITKENSPIKFRILESMSEEFPKGVRFVQFVSFLTEKIGHFRSLEGAKQFFTLVSRDENSINLKHLEVYCQEVGIKDLEGEQIGDLLTSMGSKNQEKVNWDQFKAVVESSILKK